MPYFIPFKGCPYKCVYCDQNAISGDEDVSLEEALSNFSEEHHGEEYRAQVAFFGGTFSLLENGEQEKLLETANKFIDKGAIHGIRFSTRPDALDENKLRYYAENNVEHIELGIQSFNDKYLKMMKRGYKAASVPPVFEQIKSHGISTGLQLMMGFPGQTKEEFLEDIHTAVKTDPADCRLYPLTVRKGTELEKMYYEQELTIMDMESAVEWVAEAAEIIENSGIEIRRIGLPHSVELQKNVVAGLYHPSFADKVRFLMLSKSLERLKPSEDELILVNPSDLQYANRILRSKQIKNQVLPDISVGRSKAVIQQ